MISFHGLSSADAALPPAWYGLILWLRRLLLSATAEATTTATSLSIGGGVVALI